MEIPKQLKLGDTVIEYNSCNYYQQTIYREIVVLAGVMPTLRDDATKLKHTGVLEYLFAKLKLFGSLTPAKNFYEQDELTKSM